MSDPARGIFEELDQLKKQEAGISGARERYAEEKIRRANEEEERIKKYELEIFGERGRAARGEERTRAGIQESYGEAFNSGADERISQEEGARDQNQSRTGRLAAGSDRAARAGKGFTEQAQTRMGTQAETRARNQVDQAGNKSFKPANGTAENRSEEYGTGTGEFGGRPERAFKQGEAGSVASSSGRGRSDSTAMGENRGAGKASLFTLRIRELEKRILRLAQEYRNIVDLLAMGRKGGGQRQAEQEAEREAPRRPRM